MERPNLVTAFLACLIFLLFLYYLKLTIPRDHQYHHHHHTKLHAGHKHNVRRRVKEETLYADFMEQVGTRMLQVDAWEQKMAWQRLQNDILLRREVGELVGSEEGMYEEPEFSLSDLYLHEDIDVAANRRERASYIRSMDDRLVDRIQAAFSLLPDLPRTYGGVQVPFSLEEFRDYIIGYSHQEHRKFKKESLLESVRGGRTKNGVPTFPDQELSAENAHYLPRRDYIVWATRKYLKYSRYKNYDDDSSGEEETNELQAGEDYEAVDPNRFKMYTSALYNVSAGANKEEDGKNKYVCKEKQDLHSINAERLEHDPQYLKTICER